MKILALTPLYLPALGGIEILVDHVSRRLKPEGISTVVVTDTAGRLAERDDIDGIPVHRFDLAGAIQSGRPAASLSIIDRLAKLIASERPDIVHLHSASQAGAFYYDRCRRKLEAAPPLVVTQHGVIEETDRIALVRKLFIEADMVTGVSDAVVRSVVAYSGRTGPVARIHNGVPVVAMPESPRTMPRRHRLLCVGRLQHEKGFDLAITAFARLSAAGVDAELDIVGHGDERAALEALAAQLGVASRIVFHGALDRDATLARIGAASALLVPSRLHEGFALVAAEAAMAGTPTVVSDTGGLPETVQHGVTGLVVATGDVDALAGATASVLGAKPAWERMSAAARQRAVKNFDIDRCAADYAALYRSLSLPAIKAIQ